MKPLAELIDHYRRRERETAAERDRCNGQIFGRHTTEAEHARIVAAWEDERKIARDTVSWLETIAKRATT